MSETAVIYARQSTPKQQSIPAQIKALEDYARQHDTIVLSTFQDELSGKNTLREGFNEMVEYLSANSVDFVIVWRYDRLSRNLHDLQTFLTMCSDLNVRVISINEQLSNNRAQDAFMIQILGAIGQYQREIIKVNQQIAYRQKYNAGKILSANVSYGYRLSNGTLEIHEEEAKIVRLIFNLYIHEKLGYKAIAERLNASTILNRDKLWHATRIKSILDNPFYTGAIQSKYGNTNVHHLPLIQQDEFEKVKTIQLSRQAPPQRVTRRYVLQGKIKCPYCQSTCTPTHTIKDQRDHYYYSCSLLTSGGKRHCSGITLNALTVEQQISVKLHQFIQSDFITNQLKSYINQVNHHTDKTNDLKQKKLKKREKRLFTAYESGTLSDTQLITQLGVIKKRKEKLTLKPNISESIVDLIDVNLLIDNNPTLSQYTLYQELIDWLEVDEEKNIRAIYLKGFKDNILEEDNNG